VREGAAQAQTTALAPDVTSSWNFSCVGKLEEHDHRISVYVRGSSAFKTIVCIVAELTMTHVHVTHTGKNTRVGSESGPSYYAAKVIIVRFSTVAKLATDLKK
jgi:hypothetical protein